MDTAIAENPKLLQAIELVLAKPEDIKQESINLMTKFEKAHPEMSKADILKMASDKIISNYSYFAAFPAERQPWLVLYRASGRRRQ